MYKQFISTSQQYQAYASDPISGAYYMTLSNNTVARVTNTSVWISPAYASPASALLNQSMVVMNNVIYVYGGIFDTNGVFSNQQFTYNMSNSNNGTWSNSTLPVYRASFGGVVFQNAIYLIAGIDGGNDGTSRNFTLKNDVYRSNGYGTWISVTTAAPFVARVGTAVVVSGSYMVLAGGGIDYSTTTAIADVWVTLDGSVWNLVTSQAPFGPRAAFAITTFNNMIILAGGANRSALYNDVYAFQVSTTAYVKCVCYAGWSGVNCTTSVDPCLSSPCSNDGICQNCLKDLGDGDRYFLSSSSYYQFDNNGTNGVRPFSMSGDFTISFWFYRIRMGVADFMMSHGNNQKLILLFINS